MPAETAGTARAAEPLAGGPAGPPPRGRLARWRRRPLPLIAAAAAITLLVAAAGDVALEHVARSRIVDAAACRLRPAGHVDARLSGSLAGLRMLTGDVGTVRISAKDVRREGATLSVAAEIHGVTVGGRSSGGTAAATISYDELAERLGAGVAGLRPGPDGAGGLALTGTLAGIPLPVSVRATVSTAAGRVTMTPTVVTLFGQDIPVPRLAASARTAAMAEKLAPHSFAAPPLPSGVTLTGARAGADGLRLALAVSGAAVGRHSPGCAS